MKMLLDGLEYLLPDEDETEWESVGTTVCVPRQLARNVGVGSEGIWRTGEGSGDAQNEARGFRSFISGSQGRMSTLRQAAESPSTQMDSS